MLWPSPSSPALFFSHFSRSLTSLVDFPGKNTGVGGQFLLQGIFLTQGWNSRLLHWQVDFFTTEPPGKLPLALSLNQRVPGSPPARAHVSCGPLDIYLTGPRTWSPSQPQLRDGPTVQKPRASLSLPSPKWDIELLSIPQKCFPLQCHGSHATSSWSPAPPGYPPNRSQTALPKAQACPSLL